MPYSAHPSASPITPGPARCSNRTMTGRLGYYLSYRLGLAFWDTFDTDRALTDLVEGPDALRPGRALDLGCGTGRNSVYLAQHGWDVTGIDLVEATIAQARQ